MRRVVTSEFHTIVKYILSATGFHDGSPFGCFIGRRSLRSFGRNKVPLCLGFFHRDCYIGCQNESWYSNRLDPGQGDVPSKKFVPSDLVEQKPEAKCLR